MGFLTCAHRRLSRVRSSHRRAPPGATQMLAGRFTRCTTRPSATAASGIHQATWTDASITPGRHFEAKSQ